MIDRHITEQCDLGFHLLGDLIFASAYQYIRPQSHSLQFLDALLGWFCLHLSGCFQIRNQGYMDQNRILMTDLMLELTDGLQKRLALDITYRTTHLDDRNAVFIL